MSGVRIGSVFKRAPFPAILTIVSFVLFLMIYFMLTVRSVNPHYLQGLLFAIPFVCLGLITWLTVKGKLKIVASSIITGVLIVIFGFASLTFLFIIAVREATTTTTDTAKYARVLYLSDYPQNSLIQDFPREIPKDATNVAFRYNPAFLQGGNLFELHLDASSATINHYADEFKTKSKWSGKMSDKEAQKHGIMDGMFPVYSFTGLPDDFTIYLLDGKPYHPDDWNHGYIRLVAISQQRNEMIFHAEEW